MFDFQSDTTLSWLLTSEIKLDRWCYMRKEDSWALLPDRVREILLRESGHACEDTVPVIGYLLVQKTDIVYNALVAGGKYPMAVVRFHSMFRAAGRVFGIDFTRSGFFAEGTIQYSMWTGAFGLISILANSGYNSKKKMNVEEFSIFASDNTLAGVFPSYDPDADARLARECENGDPIELFQRFFPDFPISDVHRQLAASFNSNYNPAPGRSVEVFGSSSSLSAVSSIESSGGVGVELRAPRAGTQPPLGLPNDQTLGALPDTSIPIARQSQSTVILESAGQDGELPSRSVPSGVIVHGGANCMAQKLDVGNTNVHGIGSHEVTEESMSDVAHLPAANNDISKERGSEDRTEEPADVDDDSSMDDHIQDETDERVDDARAFSPSPKSMEEMEVDIRDITSVDKPAPQAISDKGPGVETTVQTTTNENSDTIVGPLFERPSERTGSPQEPSEVYLFSPREYINIRQRERLNKTTITVRVFLVRFRGNSRQNWVYPTVFPPVGTPDGSITYSAANIMIPSGEAFLPDGPSSSHIEVQVSSLGSALFNGLVTTLSNSEDRVTPGGKRVLNVFVQHSATVEEELLSYHLNVPDETGNILSAFTGFLRSNVELSYRAVSERSSTKAAVIVITFNEGFPMALDRRFMQMGLISGKISIPVTEWDAMKEEEAVLEREECEEVDRKEKKEGVFDAGDPEAIRESATASPAMAEFHAQVHLATPTFTADIPPPSRSVTVDSSLYQQHPDLQSGLFDTGSLLDTIPETSHEQVSFDPPTHQNVHGTMHRFPERSLQSSTRSDTDNYGSISDADSSNYHLSQMNHYWGDTPAAAPDHQMSAGLNVSPDFGPGYFYGNTGIQHQDFTGDLQTFGNARGSAAMGVYPRYTVPNSVSPPYAIQHMTPGDFGQPGGSLAPFSSLQQYDVKPIALGTPAGTMGVFSAHNGMETKPRSSSSKQKGNIRRAPIPLDGGAPRQIVLREGRLGDATSAPGGLAVLKWEIVFKGEKENYLRSSALMHAYGYHGTTCMLEYFKRTKLHSSGGAEWREIFPSAYLSAGSIVEKAKHYFEEFREAIVRRPTLLIMAAPDFSPHVCTNPYAGTTGAGYILSPNALVDILMEAISIRCQREGYPYPGQGFTNFIASKKIVKIYETMSQVVSAEELRTWLRDNPDYNALTRSDRADSDNWKIIVGRIWKSMQRNKNNDKWVEDEESEEDSDDEPPYILPKGQKLKAGVENWAINLRGLVPGLLSDDERKLKRSKKSSKGKARRV